MPGAMHRMGVYLGLVEDDDYAGEADYEGRLGRARHQPAATSTASGPTWRRGRLRPAHRVRLRHDGRVRGVRRAARRPRR